MGGCKKTLITLRMSNRFMPLVLIDNNIFSIREQPPKGGIHDCNNCTPTCVVLFVVYATAHISFLGTFYNGSGEWIDMQVLILPLLHTAVVIVLISLMCLYGVSSYSGIIKTWHLRSIVEPSSALTPNLGTSLVIYQPIINSYVEPKRARNHGPQISS